MYPRVRYIPPHHHHTPTTNNNWALTSRSPRAISDLAIKMSLMKQSTLNWTRITQEKIKATLCESVREIVNLRSLLDWCKAFLIQSVVWAIKRHFNLILSGLYVMDYSNRLMQRMSLFITNIGGVSRHLNN